MNEDYSKIHVYIYAGSSTKHYVSIDRSSPSNIRPFLGNFCSTIDRLYIVHAIIPINEVNSRRIEREIYRVYICRASINWFD